MRYLWKIIKQFIYLALIFFGIYILVNAVLIVLRALNVTNITPFFTYQLPLSYDLGINLSVWDILLVTFSLILGLYFVMRYVESFINELVFFSSDDFYLHSRKNKIKHSRIDPNLSHLLSENTFAPDLKPQKPQKHEIETEKPFNDKPLDKPLPPAHEPPFLNPAYNSSAKPSLNDPDRSDKVDKILKEIENTTKAKKDDDKKKKEETPQKEEAHKTEKIEPLISKDILDHKEDSKKKESKKPEPRPYTDLNDLEEAFLCHPGIKTFFRYIIKRKPSGGQEKQPKNPAEPAAKLHEIVHRDLN